ncbi:MAG: hypothetical protein NT074_03690 [Methanomicrobiales archaeon]|nr:hypothetical protein [Methanomicrobiales archaeon]
MAWVLVLVFIVAQIAIESLAGFGPHAARHSDTSWRVDQDEGRISLLKEIFQKRAFYRVSFADGLSQFLGDFHRGESYFTGARRR